MQCEPVDPVDPIDPMTAELNQKLNRAADEYVVMERALHEIERRTDELRELIAQKEQLCDELVAKMHGSFGCIDDMPSLPSGWEQRETSDGRTYYIDHNTQSTQWQHPKNNDNRTRTRTQAGTGTGVPSEPEVSIAETLRIFSSLPQ